MLQSIPEFQRLSRRDFTTIALTCSQWRLPRHGILTNPGNFVYYIQKGECRLIHGRYAERLKNRPGMTSSIRSRVKARGGTVALLGPGQSFQVEEGTTSMVDRNKMTSASVISKAQTMKPRHTALLCTTETIFIRISRDVLRLILGREAQQTMAQTDIAKFALHSQIERQRRFSEIQAKSHHLESLDLSSLLWRDGDEGSKGPSRYLERNSTNNHAEGRPTHEWGPSDKIVTGTGPGVTGDTSERWKAGERGNMDREVSRALVKPQRLISKRLLRQFRKSKPIQGFSISFSDKVPVSKRQYIEGLYQWGHSKPGRGDSGEGRQETQRRAEEREDEEENEEDRSSSRLKHGGTARRTPSSWHHPSSFPHHSTSVATPSVSSLSDDRANLVPVRDTVAEAHRSDPSRALAPITLYSARATPLIPSSNRKQVRPIRRSHLRVLLDILPEVGPGTGMNGSPTTGSRGPSSSTTTRSFHSRTTLSSSRLGGGNGRHHRGSGSRNGRSIAVSSTRASESVNSTTTSDIIRRYALPKRPTRVSGRRFAALRRHYR